MLHDEVFPGRSILSAFHPVRLANAPFRDQREGQGLPALDYAYDAVTSVELSPVSRAVAERELSKNDRVPLFHDLDVGDTGVGHVAMYSTG